MRHWLIALCCVLGLAKPLRADTLHEDWQSLLSRHVKTLRNGHASAVDYQGFNADRDQLSRYLAALSAIEPEVYGTWSAARQLARVRSTLMCVPKKAMLGPHRVSGLALGAGR